MLETEHSDSSISILTGKFIIDQTSSLSYFTYPSQQNLLPYCYIEHVILVVYHTYCKYIDSDPSSIPTKTNCFNVQYWKHLG